MHLNSSLRGSESNAQAPLGVSGERFFRIHYEIQQRLRELAFITANLRLDGVRPVHADGDAKASKLVAPQREHLIDEPGDVDHAGIAAGRLPRVADHLTDCGRGLISLSADLLQPRHGISGEIGPIGEQLDETADNLQRVVQLVREPRNQSGHRGEPIEAGQLRGIQ